MRRKNKISGVYIITSIVNNKHYIGESANIHERFDRHKFHLRSNSHPNNHLQLSFNKYGEENFTFEVLIECDKEIRKSEENYWCNLLNTHNKKYGYNKLPTGPYGHTTQSKETRLKISNSNKGKIMWPNGKFFSEETKKKISESKMGNKAFLGKSHSEETKQKLRDIHKGKMYHPPVRHTEETKMKLSKMKKGKIFTKEHKENLSKAIKKYYENKSRLE